MTGIADAVIKAVDCVTCDSEAGYKCTYTPPKNRHQARTPGQIKLFERVGQPMIKPHLERFNTYRKQLERQAKEQHKAELKRQRDHRAALAVRAWRKRNEAKIAYLEYGKRESTMLADWLRKNHTIFRIDETF